MRLFSDEDIDRPSSFVDGQTQLQLHYIVGFELSSSSASKRIQSRHDRWDLLVSRVTLAEFRPGGADDLGMDFIVVTTNMTTMNIMQN